MALRTLLLTVFYVLAFAAGTSKVRFYLLHPLCYQLELAATLYTCKLGLRSSS